MACRWIDSSTTVIIGRGFGASHYTLSFCLTRKEEMLAKFPRNTTPVLTTTDESSFSNEVSECQTRKTGRSFDLSHLSVTIFYDDRRPSRGLTRP